MLFVMEIVKLIKTCLQESTGNSESYIIKDHNHMHKLKQYLSCPMSNNFRQKKLSKALYLGSFPYKIAFTKYMIKHVHIPILLIHNDVPF